MRAGGHGAAPLGADGEHGDGGEHSERGDEQEENAAPKGADDQLALGRQKGTPAHRALGRRRVRRYQSQREQKQDPLQIHDVTGPLTAAWHEYETRREG